MPGRGEGRGDRVGELLLHVEYSRGAQVLIGDGERGMVIRWCVSEYYKVEGRVGK